MTKEILDRIDLMRRENEQYAEIILASLLMTSLTSETPQRVAEMASERIKMAKGWAQ